jgi:thiamine kinase
MAQGFTGGERDMSPEDISPGHILAGIESFAGAGIIKQLAGGPASNSYLVTRDADRFVLRIDTDVAVSLGLDRETEMKIMTTVGANGLGPAAEYSDPQKGLLITRYVEGRVWTENDLQDPDCIRKLVALLRRLHSLEPQGHRFDIEQKVDRYAGIIATQEGDELAAKARRLISQLDDSSAPQCLCHNDLNSANIIEGEGLTLIDWEYAAIGDPMFDLATVAEHHRIDETMSEALLGAYFNVACEDDIDRYGQNRFLYRHLLVLWLAAVERLCGISAEQEIQLHQVWATLKSGGPL